MFLPEDPVDPQTQAAQEAADLLYQSALYSQTSVNKHALEEPIWNTVVSAITLELTGEAKGFKLYLHEDQVRAASIQLRRQAC